MRYGGRVSTLSCPKAAGGTGCQAAIPGWVSTHSRPKAAGRRQIWYRSRYVGFKTQPPEGGWPNTSICKHHPGGFQHTAARRRLVAETENFPAKRAVSTHSRPKAAGFYRNKRFTMAITFQHTAARRRLDNAVSTASFRS